MLNCYLFERLIPVRHYSRNRKITLSRAVKLYASFL